MSLDSDVKYVVSPSEKLSYGDESRDAMESQGKTGIADGGSKLVSICKSLKETLGLYMDYYQTPARFFGEPIFDGASAQPPLCPSDFSCTEFPPTELSNDLEILRAVNLKLANELRKEKAMSARLYSFSSRVSKKLSSLGQLSASELKTCYSLGIQIEVSNLHWFLYMSPWVPTRDIGTETGNGSQTSNLLYKESLAQNDSSKKKYKSKFPKGPRGVKYIRPLFDGIPAISLPMPVEPVDGNGKVRMGQIESKMDLNLGYDESSHDSIVILHPPPTQPYPPESHTEVHSILLSQAQPKSVTDSNYDTDDFVKSVLNLPREQDPLYDYNERIEHLDKLNQDLRSNLQVALHSAKDINSIASYIAEFVSDRNKTKSGVDDINNPTQFAHFPGKCSSSTRKSQIPVRVSGSRKSKPKSLLQTKKKHLGLRPCLGGGGAAEGTVTLADDGQLH